MVDTIHRPAGVKSAWQPLTTGSYLCSGQLRPLSKIIGLLGHTSHILSIPRPHVTAPGSSRCKATSFLFQSCTGEALTHLCRQLSTQVALTQQNKPRANAQDARGCRPHVAIPRHIRMIVFRGTRKGHGEPPHVERVLLRDRITARVLTSGSALDPSLLSAGFHTSVSGIGVSFLAASYSHARMGERQKREPVSLALQSATPRTCAPPKHKTHQKAWKGNTAVKGWSSHLPGINFRCDLGKTRK